MWWVIHIIQIFQNICLQINIFVVSFFVCKNLIWLNAWWKVRLPLLAWAVDPGFRAGALSSKTKVGFFMYLLVCILYLYFVFCISIDRMNWSAGECNQIKRKWNFIPSPRSRSLYWHCSSPWLFNIITDRDFYNSFYTNPPQPNRPLRPSLTAHGDGSIWTERKRILWGIFEYFIDIKYFFCGLCKLKANFWFAQHNFYA